jgi:cytochrome c2
MKKLLKTFGIIIAVIAGLLGIAAFVISVRGFPSYEFKKVDIKVESTPARVEQGAKLASMLCRNCHYNNETHRLSGREMKEETKFGRVFIKNITNHPTAGIGRWTDGELLSFLRTGTRPDGRYVPPYMPKLVHMSDEDISSIIAFLRSDHEWVKADATMQPQSEPSFLSKMLTNIGAFKPFPYPDKQIPGPDTNNPVKHGEYIALYQLECFACHSKDFAKNDYYTPSKSEGFFGGGNTLNNLEGKPLSTLNITMDPETGIGKWTREEFIKALKHGQLPNNQPPLRNPMMPYTNLTDKEASAIFDYLKTVPVIRNKVERKFY